MPIRRNNNRTRKLSKSKQTAITDLFKKTDKPGSITSSSSTVDIDVLTTAYPRTVVSENVPSTVSNSLTSCTEPSHSEISEIRDISVIGNLPSGRCVNNRDSIDQAPNDITPIGQQLDTIAQMNKLKSIQFPSSNKRSFQLHWLQKNEWMEYSVKRDSVFCYVCRQFGSLVKDSTFTLTGYNNWQGAFSQKKGFRKHIASEAHIDALGSQAERLKRTENNVSVSALVNSSILQMRRYYVKRVIEAIIFLIENGFSFRGNWDGDEKADDGNFESLFQYTLANNKELIKCQEHMPRNATYKSPDIQNQIIALLAKMVRDEIVKHVLKADVPFYTVLFDGTKDKHGDEIVSLACRYVLNGKPIESLLFFETSEDLDANTFTNLLLTSLKTYGLDPMKILSQCYDGAAVMNGYKSGVATRLQNLLEKVIPYVHCFNHRLRLALIDAISGVEQLRHFFEHLKFIYTVFRKPKVRKLYEGKSIKRLIDTRWTGHTRSAKSVLNSYNEIVSTLSQVKAGSNLKFDGEDIATAVGLLKIITKKDFVFLLYVLNELLDLISPIDKILQKRESIDKLKTELNRRFTENNDVLLACSDSLEMDLNKLKALEKVGIKLPHDAEFTTAKTYIEKKRAEWEEEASKEKNNENPKNKKRFNILTTLYEVKEAFPQTYDFFAAIDTFGCSTAVCEASFSSLNQIDSPFRFSMTNERMRNLAFLKFEYKRLKNINIDDVLHEFNNLKNRRVQLF